MTRERLAFATWLCHPHCGPVLKALRGDGTVILQTANAAAKIRRDKRERCTLCLATTCTPPTLPSPAPRILYAIMGNPFAGERSGPYGGKSSPRGRIPEARMLKLHLDALVALPSNLDEVSY